MYKPDVRMCVEVKLEVVKRKKKKEKTQRTAKVFGSGGGNRLQQVPDFLLRFR